MYLIQQLDGDVGGSKISPENFPKPPLPICFEGWKLPHACFKSSIDSCKTPPALNIQEDVKINAHISHHGQVDKHTGMCSGLDHFNTSTSGCTVGTAHLVLL